MDKNKNKHIYHGNLSLPALRGNMGDWIYYVGLMKLPDLIERITFPKELYDASDLRTYIQRELLAKRTKTISDYLKYQEERLFNSIVIGLYNASPNWYELNIKLSQNNNFEINDNEIWENILGNIGILKLTGNEILFPIDGQHRIAGIKDAILINKDLINEEIAVIFVSHNEKDIKRTRRLFTSLNRYAKPVDKMHLIAMDEDDIGSIITRKLINGYNLFTKKNILAYNKTEGLSRNDNLRFTSIVALYKSVVLYVQFKLGLNERQWKKYMKMRPQEKIINEQYGEVKIFWDNLVKRFSVLNDLIITRNHGDITKENRNKQNGGHLLFRPVGIFTITKTIIKLEELLGLNIEQACEQMAQLPMILNREPWNGLLWNDFEKKMNVRGTQELAVQVAYYGITGSFTNWSKISESGTEKMLEGIYNKKVKLKRYVKNKPVKI